MDTVAQAAKVEIQYPGPCSDPDLPQDVQSNIRRWWMERAAIDLEAVIEKMKLYGALDFHGYAYRRLMFDRMPPGVTGDEIAIAMYVVGKASRLIEGYSHGEKPTADTWDDIACYANMARWVRQVGHWP